MRDYDEVLAERAAFEQAVRDTRAKDKPTMCPLTRQSCAGRGCACALHVRVGWICGHTHKRSDAYTRVIDVDADALLNGSNKLNARLYVERGYLYE